ncbi:thiamine-phosphate kinase [bacterium]|nr:thiamine-phosphate kinase [bacterium]
MKKKISEKISEKTIINKLLKKLNYNKLGTFNFENDAGYINASKNYKTIVTTDTITENIDFFSNDPPESIAQKIFCTNLSDLSAMGSFPKAYTLNLSLNAKIHKNWLNKFIRRLNVLQKKYNIYLIGGDISKSKELSFTATFFGNAKLKYIIPQNKCSIDDDIWVTGNLGNSYIGYRIFTNEKFKISKNNINFFKKNYLYPNPCMFGSTISKFINSATDISDGLYGDLNKILNNKFGAKINIKKIPISNKLKHIISENFLKINIDSILNWGDDYELLFTSDKKNRNKINNLAKKNKIKLSIVGTVIKKKGIFNDSSVLIKNISSFDHFW